MSKRQKLNKCRHRKHIALYYATDVYFRPDQEPYESGVIEKAPHEDIYIDYLRLYFCERCNKVVAIEFEDGDVITSL